MTDGWRSYVPRIEELARTLGLEWSPVMFEAVPDSFMTEIAVYGLPVRMPHWSFGARYIYQLVQRHMGHSRLFEVVFPGNPGHAYLASSNALADNLLVTAHVLGHADFSRNNMLFRRCQAQVSEHIVEHAASHARQIERHIEAYGISAVEQVLDAALSLEQYVDTDQSLRRERYPDYLAVPLPPVDDAFRARYAALDQAAEAAMQPRKVRAPLPPHPERDLLWFLATYASEMESWERDIFLAVREESFYFFPVFATQIMNEGWASYWHARLLREADFIPQSAYLDAIKCHSDVVRPIAADEQVALAVNPYHLGFTLWEKIIEQSGVEHARRIMCEDDDFSFVRNHLTRELASEMGLFRYQRQDNGQYKVGAEDIDLLRETLLLGKYNFGAPRVAVSAVRSDGVLELTHDFQVDGRGLDAERAQKVLAYVQRVWRRPVLLRTVDAAMHPLELHASAAA
jgi:stage V sporulation protein R